MMLCRSNHSFIHFIIIHTKAKMHDSNEQHSRWRIRVSSAWSNERHGQICHFYRESAFITWPLLAAQPAFNCSLTTLCCSAVSLRCCLSRLFLSCLTATTAERFPHKCLPGQVSRYSALLIHSPGFVCQPGLCVCHCYLHSGAIPVEYIPLGSIRWTVWKESGGKHKAE